MGVRFIGNDNWLNMAIGTMLICPVSGCYTGFFGGAAPVDGGSTGASDTSGAGGTDDAADGTGSGGEVAACDGPLLVGGSQMRRLTSKEYQRTVEDLFGRTFDLGALLPPDAGARGFDNQAEVQEPTPGSVYAFGRLAETVTADVFSDDPSAWIGCDPSIDGCFASFFEGFGPRAFRRPLTEADRSRYLSFFEELRIDATPARAAELTVQGMLNSVNFLYLVEHGREEEPSLLDGYAIASRLSYLLWNTMPDQALFAAAQAGGLTTEQGIREQAQRMIADPRSADVVVDFYLQWSDASLLDTLTFENPELAQSMTRSSEAFLRDWYADDASLFGLMTRRTAFVDDHLAAFYGLDPIGNESELAEVELDEDRYSGLLTRPAFVSTHTIPPSRGATIMDAFLCTPLVFPADEVADPPEGEEFPTQRARFEAHASLACAAGCHTLLDPLGFPFENYDQQGRWRDFDNGHPVNAVTELSLPFADLNGEVANAVELSEVLGASTTFAACHSTKWFTYAHGRAADPDLDACDVERLEQLMVAGATVSDLLLELTTSNAFRYVQKREVL